MSLSSFESAVLAKIAELYRSQVPGLVEQVAAARFERRENTGNGYFTDLSIDRAIVAPVRCTSPLDGPTVKFDGMNEGLDHLLFLKDGYIYLLEGYAVAGEDTSAIDLADLPALPMTLRHPILNDVND